MSDNIVIKWSAKDDETAIDYFCISIDNDPWITIGRRFKLHNFWFDKWRPHNKDYGSRSGRQLQNRNNDI